MRSHVDRRSSARRLNTPFGHRLLLAAYGLVVVVVVLGVLGVTGVTGAVPPPPPSLLFDRIKIPKAITTPAPTSQINGGSVTPWACFTPAAAPGANGPVSADIAGNDPKTIAALTRIERSAFFTLSSPSCWVILLRCTIVKDGGQFFKWRPPHQIKNNTSLSDRDE